MRTTVTSEFSSEFGMVTILLELLWRLDLYILDFQHAGYTIAVQKSAAAIECRSIAPA